ncbi:hypothetical protein [Actinoplanes sp. NPDC020271]|uniref:hypothetical protein n=1 Tax=Actinoplanes sp. NPDC020271 TaxID=3363896 RepID=UPI0037B4C862
MSNSSENGQRSLFRARNDCGGRGRGHRDQVGGADRRRIAGADALAAVVDVAILDRFEILSRTVPGSDVTGVAALRVYDLSTGNTVGLSPAAGSASARGGMLWWSTGTAEATRWHSLDLRTA